MKSKKELRKELDSLNQKYIALFEKEAELRYQFEMLKDESEEIHKQDNEIRVLHKNARQLKHDMKNHLMVIASYLNDEDYVQAKAYTSELLDKFNTMHSYIETGNSLLNHILNEKLSYAKSKGIAVKAAIENLSFAKMKSMDFSALLSNMLDNAIEACEKEESDKALMQIIICRSRGYETICVKNRITDSVLGTNPELESTKEDKEIHGMGIQKMKSIVEEYGGMYDIYEEDSFFCVKVFIPQ